MKKTIRYLVFLMIFFGNSNNLAFADGADTQNKSASINGGSKINQIIVDIWNGKSVQGESVSGPSGWAWDLSPSAKAQTNNNTSDNGSVQDHINVSYGGFIYIVNLDEAGNVNNDKINHAIPIAVGVENSSDVPGKYNELLEIGYAPIFLTTSPLFRLGLNPYLAIYYQYGRKWVSNNTNDTLSRNKVELKYLLNGDKLFDEKNILRILKFKLNYDGWYDYTDKKYYRELAVSLQAKLSPTLVYDIIKYSEGNGTPSFTQGTQWTTGLTFAY